LGFTTGIVAELHPASLWAIFLHVVIAELPVAHLVEVLAVVNFFYEVVVMISHIEFNVEIAPLFAVLMEHFRIKKKMVASHITIIFTGHLTDKLFQVFRIVAIDDYSVPVEHCMIISKSLIAPPALHSKLSLFNFGHHFLIEIVDVSPIVGNEIGTLPLGYIFKSSFELIVEGRIFKYSETILRFVVHIKLAHRLVPFVAWIVEHLSVHIVFRHHTNFPSSELEIMLLIPTIRFPATRTIFPGVRSIV